MERLQKWFGGGNVKNQELKHSTEKSATVVRQESSVSTDATPQHMSVKPPEVKTKQQQVNSEQLDVAKDAKVTETRVGQFLDKGRDVILRVVPLEEGDCLSCKLIGSGAMWGAAAFVLFSYPKVKARYTGFKRTLCALQVGSLATTLTLLGAARFFDMSVFAKPDAEGNSKSVGDMVKEDLDNFYKFSSRILPTDSPADSKQDS